MYNFLMAQSQGGQGGGNPMVSMGLIILMFVVFYIFIIMPQNKKQKKLRDLIENLSKNDRVMTTGGIIGTVVNKKDNVVTIKIAENTRIDVNKAYIADKLSATD